MSTLGKIFRLVAGHPALWRARSVPAKRVLVIGIYLRDKPNLAPEIVAALASTKHMITHRWASIGRGVQRAAEMASVTVAAYDAPCPKFAIVNRMLGAEDLTEYDYVLVTDDDIELPSGFLDDFIGIQDTFGFALAQPARTLQSNADHAVTVERHSCIARQTRFVEIGPLFSIASPAFELLIPFDESFYMGWGLDHVWPVLLGRAHLTLGVIDVTPVHHRMRPVASTYSADAARERMIAALHGRPAIDAAARVHALRHYRW